MPEYPQNAKAAHHQGNVLLYAIVGKDGSVESVQLGYPTSTEQQYLGYGAMFDRSLRTATATKD